MKELEKQERDVEKQSIELQQVKEEKVEYKLIDNLRPEKGHRVWEINSASLEIVEASYNEEEVINFTEALGNLERGEITVATIKKDITVNPGCLYISALNKNNAIKRYNLNKGSAVKPQGWLQLN
jgi:hypothetical protein